MLDVNNGAICVRRLPFTHDRIATTLVQIGKTGDTMTALWKCCPAAPTLSGASPHADVRSAQFAARETAILGRSLKCALRAHGKIEKLNSCSIMGLFTPNELGARVSARETSSLPADFGTAPPAMHRWLIPACLTVLFFLGTIIAFRQTVLAMVTTWYSSRTFSHCFLVFPLSAYLVWRRRKRLAALDPVPNLWGLLPLGALSILWLLGNLGEIRLVEEWAFIGTLVTLVWTLLGSEVVRALELPLAFLVFAVPFGLSLIGPLQDLTAWFAVHALTLSRIPAVLENRVLSVPTATWTVAEACSGIRYLFSSVMLGVIYAWITYRTQTRRILFVLASVVVPVLANGVRAYGIVLLAYLTNNRLAADVDHIVYGWVFFTIVQLSLFVVGLRWKQSGSEEDLSRTVAANILLTKNAKQKFSLKAALVVALLIGILLSFTPLAAERLWNRASLSAGGPQWSDPPVLVSSPWQATTAYDMSWAPDLRGANRGFVRSYVSGQHRIDLYWALYSGERGFELLNSYNRVTNAKAWPVVADDFEYETINNTPVRLNRTLLGSGPVSRSVLTWYWVNGEYTGSAFRLKFLQVRSRLLGNSTPTCVITVSTDSTADSSTTEAVLRDFLAHTSFLDQDSHNHISTNR
jgi:exosortase A